MPRYVYDFSEGNASQKDLLGGKGANLAEMTNIGLAGATRLHHHHRRLPRLPRDRRPCPPELAGEVDEHLAALEEEMGRTLGQADDPLLVSVRSGAKFSMPGMMETVLNVGLNDESVEGLAAISGNPRFAWDSYRRLLSMFGATVLDIERAPFDEALEALKEDRGRQVRPRPRRRRLQGAGRRRTRRSSRTHDRRSTSRRSRASSSTSRSDAVFSSWNTDRAKIYRRQERIPTTSVPPSTSARWCSATSATTPAPASASPATRRPDTRACTATTWPTRRARTSSPASATRCR